MVARWFPIEEGDDSVFDVAPFRHSRTVELPVSADRAWAALTGDDVSSWTRGMRELRWTSARPFGVGTTRDVRMRGNFVLRERFYRWEDGRRKTFTGVSASRPIFRYLVEDYVVEPTPEGCRFTWRFAAEVRKEWGPLGRVFDRLVFGPVGRSHIEGLRIRLSGGCQGDSGR